jgi:hypothetical protein
MGARPEDGGVWNIGELENTCSLSVRNLGFQIQKFRLEIGLMIDYQKIRMCCEKFKVSNAAMM